MGPPIFVNSQIGRDMLGNFEDHCLQSLRHLPGAARSKTPGQLPVRSMSQTKP